MKHIARFDRFLAQSVNLNQSRLDDLNGKVDALVAYLKSEEVLGPLLARHIRQGSWAHRTIIRPQKQDEFDADVLVQLKEKGDWSVSPRIYIDELAQALSRSGRYRNSVQAKRRCVRVQYAGQCHVDLVPYFVREPSIYSWAIGSMKTQKLLVNRETNQFEPTDPEGLTRWIRNQDGRTGGTLRKCIRLYKYIRDHDDRFSIPSIVLTTLLGNGVRWMDLQTFGPGYPDVPTALRILTGQLDDYLDPRPSLPVIDDPSGSGATFEHRWSQRSYAHFRAEVHALRTEIDRAVKVKERDSSLKLWGQIFGPAFESA